MTNARLDVTARLPLIATALANGASLAALVAALLPTGGHPPLSDYIAVAAVPVAWLLGGLGLWSSVIAARHANRKPDRVLLTANIVAILVAGAVWAFWPALRTG